MLVSLAKFIGATTGVQSLRSSGGLTLAGVNTHTRGAPLAGGTLRAGNDSALGTGAVTVAGTSILTSTSANDVAINPAAQLTTNAGATG